MKDSVHASPAQTAYADILFYGCWIGLAVMFFTYLAYVSGLVAPHVPLTEMPEIWSKPVSHYLSTAHVPVGWGWLSLLRQGDFLNFLGIVLLAGLSIICYLRIIPSLYRKKDTVMAVIATAEVLVLLFAASGIVGGGAH